MQIEFERKVRKIGPERVLNIPDEIKSFNFGDKVKMTVQDNTILISKLPG